MYKEIDFPNFTIQIDLIFMCNILFQIPNTHDILINVGRLIQVMENITFETYARAVSVQIIIDDFALCISIRFIITECIQLEKIVLYAIHTVL